MDQTLAQLERAMNESMAQLQLSLNEAARAAETLYWQDKAILFFTIIIALFIGALIAKWLFRVNTIVEKLEEISEKLDDLPKKPFEWNDIMPKETEAQKNARLYGPKF